ncbi:MAG: MaoC/PaaZ C-terminal domain-containing protein [Arachnia sp.]
MAREVRQLTQAPDVGKLLVKGLAGAARKRGAPVDGLPRLSLLMDDQAQDVARLAQYCRVTGFGLSDRVPATWLHVLTFPLQAALMADDAFPFSLAGLVHVSNDMELLRPVSVADRLRLMVRAENLRPHAKGAVFDMVGEVHADDEPVWRGTSLYLATGVRIDGDPAVAERLAAPDVAVAQEWRLAPDLGRRYAAVSGDFNPIHLSPATSRLFGFRRPIIHGMWTHARALAGLGGRLPDAYRARVQFAKPIPLPGRVGFAATREDEGWRFAVVGKEGKPHLVGELRA